MHRPRYKRRHIPPGLNRCGFTLIELMVVVAVIVLLAGAAGGLYMGSHKRRQLEKSARELLIAAKYARVVAVQRQKPCKLKIDQEQRGFWLAVDEEVVSDDPTAEATVEETVIRDLYCKPAELPGPVNFEEVMIYSPENMGQMTEQSVVDEEDEETTTTGQQDEIVFQPSGAADAAIVILGNGQSRYTLMIMPATGKAKLQFGTPDASWNMPVDLDE